MMILIIGGLITWRLAHMISKELGPLAVFARFRAYFATTQKSIGGFYDMVSCVACTSIYMAAVVSLGFAGGIFSWIVYTLSFSAIAMIFETVYNGL